MEDEGNRWGGGGRWSGGLFDIYICIIFREIYMKSRFSSSVDRTLKIQELTSASSPTSLDNLDRRRNHVDRSNRSVFFPNRTSLSNR